MAQPQRLLERLDAIGAALRATDTALALLGLGSVGLETERLDAYSDLDFFVIVRPDCKQRYLARLDWLSSVHPIAYAFQNTPVGYKALFDDGIFCEFAVFEEAELSAIPFTGGRIIWQDAAFDERRCAPPIQQQIAQTLEFHLGEALTNLYVGLGRVHRGEILRFISVGGILKYHQEEGRHDRNTIPRCGPKGSGVYGSDQFNAGRICRPGPHV